MMIEWLFDHWGDLASVISLLVSSVGLAWAIKVAYGARQASLDTSARIVGHLQTVDLERALGLIRRIKLLHTIERWHAAIEQYQTLRAMMADIIARWPAEEEQQLAKLSTARTLIIQMESSVERNADLGPTERERSRFLQQLNQIQGDLEELAGSIGFGE